MLIMCVITLNSSIASPSPRRGAAGIAAGAPSVGEALVSPGRISSMDGISLDTTVCFESLSYKIENSSVMQCMVRKTSCHNHNTITYRSLLIKNGMDHGTYPQF